MASLRITIACIAGIAPTLFFFWLLIGAPGVLR